MKEKRIFILMGASGVGKTTLGNFLKEQGIPELVSHTTREKRSGEIDGETYYFVSKEEFDQIEKIEFSNYNGNFYCLSKKEVEEKLQKHDKVFVIADINGVKQIKAHYPKQVTVIYISASLEEMKQRMKARGDSEEKIQSRIDYALKTKELENGKYADYIIENHDLNQAKKELLRIVLGENKE